MRECQPLLQRFAVQLNHNIVCHTSPVQEVFSVRSIHRTVCGSITVQTAVRNCPKSDSSNAPTVDLTAIRRPNGPKGTAFQWPARLRCRHLRAFSDGFSRHLGEQGYNKEKGPSIEVSARSCLIVCSERAWQRASH
jgi:hypothetical protein